jgi:hypothetical protein
MSGLSTSTSVIGTGGLSTAVRIEIRHPFPPGWAKSRWNTRSFLGSRVLRIRVRIA